MTKILKDDTPDKTTSAELNKAQTVNKVTKLFSLLVGQ